jgi:glycosyltransferase 2 family protein
MNATTTAPANAGPRQRQVKRIAARVAPVAAGVAGLGGLLTFVNPHAIGAAVAHFDGWVLVPVLLLILSFYVLQGIRWHFLLRGVGAGRSIGESQLINFAGQALTAVLPLGDLSRALMASRAARVPFGATAATVTIQELTFTLLVVLCAAPGLMRLPNGVVWMLAITVAIAGIVTILIVPRVFAVARGVAAATPGVRRFARDIDALQREVRSLLVRPDVLAGAALDLARVLAATAALLLILRGMHIDALGWWDVSLVLAASFVGGALSLLPGGVGANEASVVGVLVLLGVNPAAAAGAAILQRLTLTLVPTMGGGIAYAVLRRRRIAGSGDLLPRRRSAHRSIPATSSLDAGCPVAA